MHFIRFRGQSKCLKDGTHWEHLLHDRELIHTILKLCMHERLLAKRMLLMRLVLIVTKRTDQLILIWNAECDSTPYRYRCRHVSEKYFRPYNFYWFCYCTYASHTYLDKRGNNRLTRCPFYITEYIIKGMNLLQIIIKLT